MERRVKMTSVKILRQSLLVLMLAVSTFGCLGRATPPEQVKMTQQQNEVLGKFARRVGEQELNILLKDPNDATLPGIPVGDLLYILANVNEDKLIRLVQGIGATSTLELILALKRIGCTRANNHPVAAQYSFDARALTGANGMNSCTWQQFHLPNIMVQLLAGTTDVGLTTLIDAVKHSYTTLSCPPALPANQALCTGSLPASYTNGVSHHQYLTKLAYVVVSFDSPTAADPNMARANLNGPRKLYEVMNMALDGRDMVYLLDSFDRTFIEAPGVGPATCPDGVIGTLAYPPLDLTLPANGPTYKCIRVADGLGTFPANTLETYSATGDLWADIEFGYQLGGMKLLLDIMVAVTDGTKMGVIINGRRTTRYLTSEDEAQIVYYVDKLKVLLEHSRPTGCTFPGTGPENVAGTEQFRQNYAAPHGGDAEWTAKIAALINNITNVNRMMDLVYDIDISGTCPNRGIDNLLVMLNNINNTDPHPAINGYILAPDDTTINNEVITAAYLIDNIPLDPRHPNPAKRNKLRYLVENLGNTLDMLKLTCYSAPADNNVVTAEVCDGRGLLNQVAARSKFADPYSPAPTFPATVVSDPLAGGKKLVNLTAQVYDMNDMKFLVKHVSMDNMSQLISGLQIAGTARVADLVNQISGDDCWNENNGLIKTVGPYNVTAAKVTGNVSGGVLTSVTVVSPGANYPPGTAIAGFPGCTTQPVVQLSFSGGPTVGGFITGATITSGGAGCTNGAAQPARFYETNGFPTSLAGSYNVTNIPAVTFGGIGAGAVGKAVVDLQGPACPATGCNPNYGKIMDVIVLNSGSGYSPPGTAGGISFTPNNGGANIVASATQGAFSGSCRYNSGTGEFRGFPSANGTGALGLGKLVNTINHLSGSINNLVTLINGVTDASQLGILINGISRSSNLVGVMNATIDTNRKNNANISDLMNLLNATPIVDTYKLIHLMDNLGNAVEVDANVTLPSGDHDMVAQLIASYCRSDLAGLASATCPATPGNYVHSTSGVGYAAMANLIKSLTLTGGGGYIDGAVVTGFGGSEGILNVATAPAVNAVTGIVVTSGGSGCGNVSVNLVGGGGTGATAAAYVAGGVVTRVNILSSGSGYSGAPAVAFTGCTTAPVATAYINGIGTVTVTKPGSGLTDTFAISPGGGTGGVITATVSGTITNLRSISGGTRYVTGQICPISGAGGVGATCTVTADAAGGLVACAIASAGNNYGDERIVRIGGNAEVVASINSVTQQITGYTVVHGGCGYSGNAPSYVGAPYAAPSVQIVGCTTPPVATATVDASGVVTGVTGIGGTGCGSGVKVIIGESPFAYHADGGSAIVDKVASGRVTSMSVSNASINAAQLVQMLDRDATGQGPAFNYRADDATWSPLASACSGGGAMPCAAGNTLRPNISTREAMIRMLHHGFTPTTTSSKGIFNGAGGIGPGALSLDWPGVGPQYIAGSILNNVSGDSTQVLVNMMNSDIISLEDTLLMLGCGDRSTYTNSWSTYSWQQLCTAVGPGLW